MGGTVMSACQCSCERALATHARVQEPAVVHGRGDLCKTNVLYINGLHDCIEVDSNKFCVFRFTETEGPLRFSTRLELVPVLPVRFPATFARTMTRHFGMPRALYRDRYLGRPHGLRYFFCGINSDYFGRWPLITSQMPPPRVPVREVFPSFSTSAKRVGNLSRV